MTKSETWKPLLSQTGVRPVTPDSKLNGVESLAPDAITPSVIEQEESKQASLKRIPIKVAEEIGKKYGYDQVMIITRSVGKGGGETVVTWGRNPVHCNIAAKCGDFLKYRIMGWHKEQKADDRRK